MSDIDLLIGSIRPLEADYAPDGWPAVQMRDISALCNAAERATLALDLLQERLEQGASIAYQDREWMLFRADGESICSGGTVREMLGNLIFADC